MGVLKKGEQGFAQQAHRHVHNATPINAGLLINLPLTQCQSGV